MAVKGAEVVGALEGVAEDLGAEVKEAANGEIRDTILGAIQLRLLKESLHL
jgi:hypothetical protein